MKTNQFLDYLARLSLADESAFAVGHRIAVTKRVVERADVAATAATRAPSEISPSDDAR